MKTIQIYSANKVLSAYSFHIDKMDIEALNGGYIEFIEHFPGGTISKKIEPLNQCKLFAEENMCIKNGEPAFKDNGKYYKLPVECYEIYEGEEQEPLTLKEVLQRD